MIRHIKIVLSLTTLLVMGYSPASAQPDVMDEPPVEATLPSLGHGVLAMDAAIQSSAATSTGLPTQATPPRTLRAHWHVYIAFAATWLLLFGYAVWLGRRFGRLEEEIRQVRNV